MKMGRRRLEYGVSISKLTSLAGFQICGDLVWFRLPESDRRVSHPLLAKFIEYMYIYISYLEKSRHPGNWLPSLWGLKRFEVAKNDVKWPKPTQN